MEHRRQKYLSLCLLITAFAISSISLSPAWASSFLGSAGNFAVLAGGPVTCTGSAVTGDVGAGTVVTRTGCTISGRVHQGDLVAKQAYADYIVAYAALGDNAKYPCTGTLNTAYAGTTLTLTPGVYCNTGDVTFTNTTLTLNGPVNGVWVFKIGTGTTGARALTSTGLTVVMSGGGQPCNVDWWVSQGATLTDSHLQGTVLAGADITVTRGTFNGDALAGGNGLASAPTGAVTLTNGAAGAGATIAGCAATETGGGHCKQGDSCDTDHSNHGNDCKANDGHGGNSGDSGDDGDDGDNGDNGDNGGKGGH